MVCESICTLIMRIVKEMRCEDRKSNSAEVFMNMNEKSYQAKILNIPLMK